MVPGYDEIIHSVGRRLRARDGRRGEKKVNRSGEGGRQKKEMDRKMRPVSLQDGRGEQGNNVMRGNSERNEKRGCEWSRKLQENEREGA